MSIDLGNTPVGTPPTVDQKTQIRNSIGAADASAVTVSLATKAPLASPTFTGTPAAPTATAGTNTTQIATTAFVGAAITNGVAGKANIVSPTFSGTPSAPTATAGTNTTQIATTAFVTDAVSGKAPVASPAFTGTPTAPTATAGTNTTQVATTAFVTNAVSPTTQTIGPAATSYIKGYDTSISGADDLLIPVRDLLARQFGADVEVAAVPISGSHALRLDQSRYIRFVVGGNLSLTISSFGEANVSDKGEFTLVWTFNSNVLRTITFPSTWVALEDSAAIDNRFATYVLRGIIVGTSVFYKIEEYFYIDEASYTNHLMVVGDLGEDSGPAFSTSMSYLAAQTMDYLLYAGDVNYPSGSSATIDTHTAPLNTLIAAQKVLPTFGNHDLDTNSLNFTTDSTLMALAGTWRWSNANQFSSNYRTVAATSAGWSTVTGGVPGFGESDTGTGAITNDSGATFYFARVLNLGSAPAAGKKLRIRMYIDDGARVYINGVKVYEFNLKYPVSDTSLAHVAMAATADNEGVWTERGLHTILVDGTALTSGDNLIAVEVHQSSTSSSDLSWDMSIEVGSSTDAVPSFSGDVKFVNGYGQPMINKFPYIPNACQYYHYTVGSTMDVFVLNDGINTSGFISNPATPHDDGQMHDWFATKLAASTRPFKIVMVHRLAVSTYGATNYTYADLDWPEFKAPGVVLVFGHTHQTNHLTHSSGAVAINASNSGGQTPRAIEALAGVTSGWTNTWSDASTNYAVARIDASTNFLRVRFEKTSDGSVMHQFIISAP